MDRLHPNVWGIVENIHNYEEIVNLNNYPLEKIHYYCQFKSNVRRQ